MNRTTDIPAEISRYRVRVWPLVVMGGGLLVTLVPIAALGLLRLYDAVIDPAAGFVLADGVILLALLVLGGLAAGALGLAARRPVGLRLDAHGVSGYFAPTLRWSDIEGLEAGRRGRAVGVVVYLSEAAMAARAGAARTVLERMRAQASEVFVNTTHLAETQTRIFADFSARWRQSREGVAGGESGMRPPREV